MITLIHGNITKSVQMEQHISDLDSARFGFKVAKLNGVEADPSSLVRHLAEDGVKLVIARIAASDVGAINRLEALGFCLKDVQVTYRFDLTQPHKPPVQPDSCIVRDLEHTDVEQVIAVAAESFTGYGHYAADERLDQARCRDAYADWARRSCEDPAIADKVIVAIEHGVVRGFLTFKLLEQSGRKYAAGGIGAVAPGHRGQGMFSAIVLRGLDWGRSLGLAWEEHNALVTNYAVNRVFAGIGFRIGDAAVTLHAWL